MDWPATVKILREILDGLEVIHKAEYVIGDMKTDNVMLTKVMIQITKQLTQFQERFILFILNVQKNEVKLIDFGSASKEKLIHCCTPGYAAPEVAAGNCPNPSLVCV